MLRPTLAVQTVFLHDTDRDEARRLGSDLYQRLTRPTNDPLAFGPGIPVFIGVSADHVDLANAETVVVIPVLGKTAFHTQKAEVLSRLQQWHEALGAGHALPVLTARVWRNAETELPGKPLLTELYGQDDARRKTIDKILIAVTRLLDPDPKAVKLFVSHSKRDLEATDNAAKQIHIHGKTNTNVNTFFDAVDLEPGNELNEQIQSAASRGVLIAVHGDTYSSREWCQKELLTAKQHKLPTLTVEVLKKGEQRASPYIGNGPSIVWDNNPAAVVSRALVEWLAAKHFLREANRVCKAAGLPKSTRKVSRPPELLDLAQGPLNASRAQLVLHPDPELPVSERQILRAVQPRLSVVTPTTVFRRLLSRDGSRAVAAPLEKLQVAMSLSDSPDVDGPDGYTASHVIDATVYIARSLISAGASIAYGGDFRRNGFTPLLSELIGAYNETAAKRVEFLHSYLGAPIDIGAAPDLPMIVHHLVHSPEVCRDAVMPPPSDSESHPPALYFSDMRQVMAKHTDARVILGGNAEPRQEQGGPGYGGRYPGIVEEAWRTLEVGQPLYVIGGYGGAAALVADLFGAAEEVPTRLRDETWTGNPYFRENAAAIDVDSYREQLGLPLRMQDLAAKVRELGKKYLQSDDAAVQWNGLTREENYTLFRSRDPLILASLVLKGLLTIARERDRGTGGLNVELVQGSITSASQLDAIALATFDNVPLGGAGAALDLAVSGKASLGHAEGRSLIDLQAPDIDADWLYLASLGSMTNARQIAEAVESAARATAEEALRHGFTRLGIVTFGGTLGDSTTRVTEAMLRGFADLQDFATVVWFETDEHRYDQLRAVFDQREDVKYTTRVVKSTRLPERAREEPLLLQVSLEDDQLSVTAVPPAGTGIATARVVELGEAQLSELALGRGPRQRATPDMETLERRGKALTELLLGSEGEQIIARSGKAKLVIIHDVPSSRLPFEMLATSTNRLAATNGICRRLTVAEAPVGSLFGRPPRGEGLKVVLVVNPTGDLDGTEIEADAVRAALDEHKEFIQLTPLRRDQATKQAVLDALADADVLHYCGHAFFHGPGDDESGLRLADGELTLKDLKETSAFPRVVFFNACEAGRVRGAVTTEAAAFAELILQAGVEAYLGTYWEVGDAPAAQFASGVYSRLAAGMTLDKAVMQSRGDLIRSHHRDWANYILYGDGRFILTKANRAGEDGPAVEEASGASTNTENNSTEGAKLQSGNSSCHRANAVFSMHSLRNEGFSWRSALSLAAASKLAYENSSVVVPLVTESWEFDTCQFIEQSHTEGFIARTSDVVLIAFRGTESVGDWVTDLNIARSDESYGQVHAGFLEGYRVVHDEIAAALASHSSSVGVKVWITGHSLGGALATVAAAELRGTVEIAGIYTYGQPRVGDSRIREFFSANYAEKFFRFVNDDDLVTRVPPGFAHVGKLIHFDSDGSLHRSLTEAVSEEEPTPLTEEEFRELQQQLKAIRSALLVRGAAEATEASFGASAEGLFPSISDHSLDRYIAAIRRFTGMSAFDEVVEIEQTARGIVEAAESTRGGGPLRSAPDLFPVLLRLNDPQWQPPSGLKVNSKLGTIVTAQATADQLEMLRNDDAVASVEASRDAGCEECDSSIPFVGADKVHGLPDDESGDSAIVGVIDSGIDIEHAAFRDDNNKSRVRAVWNQRDNQGPTPKGVDETLFSQDYGTLYTAAEIAAFLDPSNPAQTPTALRDPGPSGHPGHGTHVASIAAGRKTGSFAGGMAPESKLLVVIPHVKHNPGDPPSLGYSASHVDVLQFLKLSAQQEGLPLAVNVSLGMNAGAHDGTSLLEAAFDSITGHGRNPGIVIVKSAGNERGHRGHARVRAFQGITPIQWDSSDGFRFQDYIEIWYSSLDELTFTLIDPAGNQSQTVSRTSPEVKESLGGNFCHLRLREFHPDNGDSRLVLTIVPQASPIQTGRWSLKVRGTSVRSAEGRVDAWVERDVRRAIRFVANDNDKITISIPGTAHTVITVSACHSSDQLELTNSSSFGRTRDERPKPDICAPGFEIEAALSSASIDGAVARLTGTSMAAPHVTGALALTMSHREKQAGVPQVNARQLQAALVRTAKKFSGLHHEGFGYGVLDAKALFEALR